MKLPFVVQPKQQEVHLVGDDSTGKLEIPKLYDLSVNERIFLDEEEKKIGVEDVSASAMVFAKEISSRTGIHFNEAFEALSSNNLEIIGPHAELLIEFNKKYTEFTLNRKVILAYLMVKRILPTVTKEWCGDAKNITPKMLNFLSEFAENEMRGWVKKETPDKEESSMVQVGVAQKGKKEPKLIGEASIGN